MRSIKQYNCPSFQNTVDSEGLAISFWLCALACKLCQSRSCSYDFSYVFFFPSRSSPFAQTRRICKEWKVGCPLEIPRHSRCKSLRYILAWELWSWICSARSMQTYTLRFPHYMMVCPVYLVHLLPSLYDCLKGFPSMLLLYSAAGAIILYWVCVSSIISIFVRSSSLTANWNASPEPHEVNEVRLRSGSKYCLLINAKEYNCRVLRLTCLSSCVMNCFVNKTFCNNTVKKDQVCVVCVSTKLLQTCSPTIRHGYLW